jgi:hypothetical protein
MDVELFTPAFDLHDVDFRLVTPLTEVRDEGAVVESLEEILRTSSRKI